MRFAYADPPYLGCGTKFYADHPEAAVYDSIAGHAALIQHLCDEFPDGWAMSASSSSLQLILPLCPDDVRIAAWVKPFHVFKKGVRPAYAWEPVIYRGGRNKGHKPPVKGGLANTPRDWVSANITLRKGLTGTKPEAVCAWILDLLNVAPEDEVVDLFPGLGTLTRALEERMAS